MATKLTYSTVVTVNGYEYPLHCTYIREKDRTIELLDVQIQTEEERMWEFPCLTKVDDDIIGEIEELYE